MSESTGRPAFSGVLHRHDPQGSSGPGPVATTAFRDDDVRMFGLLTRSMAGELLKTILITTGVLVSVIAFGAAIKPLARNLLGGTDILRYVGLASIPMLQYALPFSAGFGATLVMHRMVTDNEVLAMSAAGLSHRRILRPVFLLGGLLLVVMLLLVNVVVPVFWSRMESMLARDVTRLLSSAVQRGEAFDLGDTRIFADDVLVDPAPEGSTAETRLILGGVAALQISDDGGPETEFTADYATLDVYRVDGRSILKLVLGDATVFRSVDETLVRTPAAEPRAIDLGHRFQPSPKMFTIDRMLELRADPRLFWRVRIHLDRLAERARSQAIERAIVDRLATEGRLELRDPRQDSVWTLSVPSIDPEDPLRLRDVVVERDRRGDVSVATVPSVRWRIERRTGVEVIDLDFERDEGTPMADLVPPFVRSLEPTGVAPPDRPSDDDLVAWASSVVEDPDTSASFRKGVEKDLDGLASQARRLVWDIDARIQQRLAQAITAPLLLILGAILAINLRHSTPLAVYVAAFLPAIGDILLISGGEQTLRRDPSTFGHLLLWSGNALLAILCIAGWMRLRRH